MSDEVTVSYWVPDGSQFRKVGEIGEWSSLSFEPRYNSVGPWSMSLPLSAQALGITNRHVVTFDFRGWRMTGLVENAPGPVFDGGNLSLEMSGVDALAKLGHFVCDPEPDAGSAAQYRARYQDKGPAETVLHDLIVAEVVERVGYPLVVPPSQGRGSTVRVNEYFKNLLELVLRKAKNNGIGVRVGLVDTTPMRAQMTLGFYVPAERSRRVILTPDLGTVASWRSEVTAPTATRARVAAAYVETIHPVEHFDLDKNALTLPGDDVHDFKTGDRIRFTGRNDPPDPLDRSADFFAIRVDADTFKVAKSRAKALDGTAINITDFGLVIQNVNVDNDNLTISDGTVPRTGSRVRFHGGGNLPNPLNKGDVYYAIKVDRDTFKVANSDTAAAAGNAINLTSDKSGEVRVFESGSIRVVEVKRQVRDVDSEPDLDVHDIREVFVDARNEDSDDNDVFVEKGQEALLNGAANTTFSLAATEAEGMRFASHYDVGDLVTVQLLEDTATVANLGAVRLSSSTDAGLTVELIPGDPDGTSPLFKQAALIRDLRAQIRALQEDD